MPRQKGWDRNEVSTRTKKACVTCRVVKPLTAFHKHTRSIDGYRGECKACRSTKAKVTYQKDHAHWRNRYEQQRDFVRQLNIDRGACLDCNETYPPQVMHFHHVRGDKSFNIGSGAGKSKMKILAEIDKCELLCANCHIMRHIVLGL